jgi:hypothetical protein
VILTLAGWPSFGFYLAGGCRASLASTWAKTRTLFVWLRRSIETNPNYSVAHFLHAAALAHLGRMEEARAAVKAGLIFDPSFTIGRRRDNPFSTSPEYIEQIERYYA